MVRLQLCDHHHPRCLGDATSPKQFSRQQKLSGEDRWVNILLKCPYYCPTVDDGVLCSVTMKMTMMSPLLCLSMVACCLVSLVHTSPMYRGEYLLSHLENRNQQNMVLIILKVPFSNLSGYIWIVTQSRYKYIKGTNALLSPSLPGLPHPTRPAGQFSSCPK